MEMKSFDISLAKPGNNLGGGASLAFRFLFVNLNAPLFDHKTPVFRRIQKQGKLVMARTRYHDPDSPIFDRPQPGQSYNFEMSNGEIERARFYKHLLDEKLHQELRALAGSDLDLELAVRRAEKEPIRLTAKRLNLDPSTVSRRGKKALQWIQIGVLAKLIQVQLVRFGRVIVTPNDPQSIDPKHDAFAVPLFGFAEHLDAIPTWNWIACWLGKQWSTLQLPVGCADGNLRIPHIHVWFRDGKGEINLAVVVEDESTANLVALENSQPFIHDVATGRTTVVRESHDPLP